MTTFSYLVSFAVYEILDMHKMDVITTYLYRNLDNDNYIRIFEGFSMPKECKSNSQEIYFKDNFRNLP